MGLLCNNYIPLFLISIYIYRLQELQGYTPIKHPSLKNKTRSYTLVTLGYKAKKCGSNTTNPRKFQSKILQTHENAGFYPGCFLAPGLQAERKITHLLKTGPTDSKRIPQPSTQPVQIEISNSAASRPDFKETKWRHFTIVSQAARQRSPDALPRSPQDVGATPPDVGATPNTTQIRLAHCCIRTYNGYSAIPRSWGYKAMDSFTNLHDSCNLCGQPLAAHNNDVNADCPSPQSSSVGWLIIAAFVALFVYSFFGASGWF